MNKNCLMSLQKQTRGSVWRFWLDHTGGHWDSCLFKHAYRVILKLFQNTSLTIQKFQTILQTPPSRISSPTLSFHNFLWFLKQMMTFPSLKSSLHTVHFPGMVSLNVWNWIQGLMRTQCSQGNYLYLWTDQQPLGHVTARGILVLCELHVQSPNPKF